VRIVIPDYFQGRIFILSIFEAIMKIHKSLVDMLCWRGLKCLPSLLMLLLCGCVMSPETPKQTRIPTQTPQPSFKNNEQRTEFEKSRACNTCHSHLWEQHSKSIHAKSLQNPIFQAHYFGRALFLAREGGRLFDEAASCARCHMPIAHTQSNGFLVMRKDVPPDMPGVTCDICHRISGYEGKVPGNGNFHAKPGGQKYGPFKKSSDWHHVYLKLQTESEFCAICHNAVNTLGVEVKSTYTEWLASPQAKKGIQCQDCHMSQRSVLVDGKRKYESGKAAQMTLGNVPYRKKLYSHKFQGSRTKTQLQETLSLKIEVAKERAAPGEEIAIRIIVDNTNSGHRTPSGSIDLRYIWLDVGVRVGGKLVDIPATSIVDPGYDVSGNVADDKIALGANFPKGKRMYRAIFFDEEGKRTHSLIYAASKPFDNRLQAGKKHEELYSWRVPEDSEGEVQIEAVLNYAAYPHSFAKLLNIGPCEPVVMATTEHKINVGK
jgi:hypothetical protein